VNFVKEIYILSESIMFVENIPWGIFFLHPLLSKISKLFILDSIIWNRKWSFWILYYEIKRKYSIKNVNEWFGYFSKYRGAEKKHMKVHEEIRNTISQNSRYIWSFNILHLRKNVCGLLAQYSFPFFCPLNINE